MTRLSSNAENGASRDYLKLGPRSAPAPSLAICLVHRVAKGREQFVFSSVRLQHLVATELCHREVYICACTGACTTASRMSLQLGLPLCRSAIPLVTPQLQHAKHACRDI